jgi:hypothetical protein
MVLYLARPVYTDCIIYFIKGVLFCADIVIIIVIVIIIIIISITSNFS